MAHDRRVSFVPRWNDGRQDGDGLLVVQPQSVFNRLGPKVSIVDMCDPPYVPESVGEPPLAGMIFGCTNETYAECMNRELFGLPIANKPQVMRIAPGASLFLFNFRTKCLYGIFEATSHGGVHIVRDAFRGKYGAQVKVRLAEDCPSLDEREFKDSIRANYLDARKFKFFLTEAQVCRLKTIFREKAADEWAVSKGIVGRRLVQLHPSEHQHARNIIQVQRRVINNASNDEVEGSRTVHASPSLIRSRSPKGLEVSIRGKASNDEVEGSRTVLISAPPILSRLHASPSHIQSRSPKGLEVSICSMDKKRNGAPDSPRRHVVMYDTRKEQSTPPVLRSKITRPARHEAVKEGVQSRSGRGISQDRKRHADRSPHGRLLFQDQDQGMDEDRSGNQCADLREFLNRPKNKKLKASTKESAKRLLSKPMDPSVDSGGKISKTDVLSNGNLKRDLEQGLPPPSKKHSTISLGPQKPVSSKDLVTPKKAGSVQESRKDAGKIGPVEGVQGNLKSASVCAGDRMRSLTASGSHCANPKPMAVGTEGQNVIEACRSENACNNADMEFKAPDGDGVGSCVQLSTNLPVKSAVLHNLDDLITELELGDLSKNGGLDIYVSLTVEEAEIARQTDSRIVSENQHGMDGVVRCILGKRCRESNQHEPALDSSMAAQSPQPESSVPQQKEGPKESHPEYSLPKISSFLANVSETHQERENGTCFSAVPSAEEQYLTSQVHTRNGSLNMENLSEEEKRLDHEQLIPTNILPLNNAIPVISTVITGNTGDMRPRDCKRHRAEKSGPSSPVHKLSKIGHNDAGCSYVTPEVSTPTEGSDMGDKVLQKYGVDDKMPPQNSANSLFSGKSGNLWNSRTLRYGRPRSSDALANHGSKSSKSASEPTSASGKSEPNVGSMKIWEESVYSGGENYERQPESPNATEASRTSGSLRTQCPLLVCELGNPGGLPLDGKTIRVDTLGDTGSLRKDQPSRVAAVMQESTLPIQIDSTTRPDSFQPMNTALDPRSDELETLEFRKKIATVKGLTEEESQVADKICHTDDSPSKESIQPTMIVSNGERAHPSLLPCMPHGADAPQGARGLVEDDIQDCLDATSRGFPSTCTSTASLSDCSGPSGEAELEINIPIEEEELEICLPIEEDEEVDAGPKDQIRRLWGSSNRDITPWKLLQKNPSQNT